MGCSQAPSLEEHGTLDAEFPAVKESGPAHESKNCIIDAAVTDGQAEISLPIDTPEDAVMVLLGEESAKMKTAASRVIRGTAFDEPDLQTMDLPTVGINYSLASLKAGQAKMKLSSLKKGSLKAIIIQPKSPLSLNLKITPLVAKTGETVTVESTVADEKLPLSGSVTAEFEGGSIVLKDDGAAPDAVKNDGIYTGCFTAPKVDEFKTINLNVKGTGTRHNGVAFARTVSASVLVNPAGTEIDIAKIAVSKEAIVLPVSAADAFNARFEIIYGSGGTTTCWTKKELQVDDGSSSVSVPRSEESLSANRAVVRLLNMDSKGLECEFEIALTPFTAVTTLSRSAAAKASLPAGKKRAAALYGN
jgi:hypothetical protein